MTRPSDATLRTCPACGTQTPAALLTCPACHRLLHTDTLKRLAAEAADATAEGRSRDALIAWRSALDLLPAGSRQHEQVRATVDRLSRSLEANDATAPDHAPGWGGRGGAVAAGLGGLALLAWKFKFAAVFLLTKGKLLLLGLTKSSTLFSMLLSLGVYWAAWGWVFALGVVLSLYVHEMGHVAALHRLGIRASAPMFLPGLGAMVRLSQYPASAREDARVGLAGPIWGLGAAAATYGAHLATGAGALGAIARVAAWINLFNLVPVWQLDGSRGFRALGRSGRWTCAAVAVGAFVTTGDGLLLLLGAAMGIRALGRDVAEDQDARTLVEFVVLIVALSALTTIPIPPTTARALAE